MKTYRFIIVSILVSICLMGCTEETSRVTSSTESVDVEQTSSINQEDEEVIAMRSPEGLSLTDERIGITPVKLEIPALQVDAVIEKVGRLENGQMGVPQNPDSIGWFEPGVKPGSQGNAVMAGHIDSYTGPAVFYELDQLVAGDEIIVHGEDDEKLRFIVTGTATYPRNDAPVSDIFGFNYSSNLNLITCTGEFNRKAKTHEERLVVYTEVQDE